MVVDVTHPFIGVDFLSHFGLLKDCKNNRLLDEVTSLSVPALATSSQNEDHQWRHTGRQPSRRIPDLWKNK
jgi:hypothetical protein